MEKTDRDRLIWRVDWEREHADHGGFLNITYRRDPPGMIRQRCACGDEHFGRDPDNDRITREIAPENMMCGIVFPRCKHRNPKDKRLPLHGLTFYVSFRRFENDTKPPPPRLFVEIDCPSCAIAEEREACAHIVEQTSSRKVAAAAIRARVAATPDSGRREGESHGT